MEMVMLAQPITCTECIVSWSLKKSMIKDDKSWEQCQWLVEGNINWYKIKDTSYPKKCIFRLPLLLAVESRNLPWQYPGHLVGVVLWMRIGRASWPFCDLSEMALPITETKIPKHFSIQTTPQNLGKITSETTFGHSKVFFRPLRCIKRAITF